MKERPGEGATRPKERPGLPPASFTRSDPAFRQPLLTVGGTRCSTVTVFPVRPCGRAVRTRTRAGTRARRAPVGLARHMMQGFRHMI